MKRLNKCVGKSKYKYLHKALKTAEKHYRKNKVVLGIYECPICLDFHLTSKHDLITRKYLIEWNAPPKKKVKSKKNAPLKKKKKEKQVLPLAMQRELLSQFDNKTYTQSKSLFASLIDIIKSTWSNP
jgi:hypothetical protein